MSFFEVAGLYYFVKISNLFYKIIVHHYRLQCVDCVCVNSVEDVEDLEDMEDMEDVEDVEYVKSKGCMVYLYAVLCLQ